MRKQIKNKDNFNYTDISKRVCFFYPKQNKYLDKVNVKQNIELIEMHTLDPFSSISNSSNQLTIHKIGLYIFILGGVLNFFEHINDYKAIDVNNIDISIFLMLTGYLVSQFTNLVHVITNNHDKSDLTWCTKDFFPIKLNKVIDEVRLGFNAGISLILLQTLISLIRINFHFEKFLQSFSYPQKQPSNPLRIILLPLFEEAIFRKSIVSLYKKELEKYGISKINIKTWSVILDSLTFMAMHRPYFINHFFLGLVFGALMNVTGSRLLASYVAHTLHNAILIFIDSCEDYQRIVIIGALFLSFVALFDRALYQRYFSIDRKTPEQMDEISCVSMNLRFNVN